MLSDVKHGFNYKLTLKRAKTVKDSNLVWVDCEMTGLDPNKDHLLEIAVIVTDKDLNVLAEGPNLVIHQSDEVWNHEIFCHVILHIRFYIQTLASDTKMDFHLF